AIAPEDLLGALLELSIQGGSLPIARAVRLQIDLVQDVPHGAWADRGDDALRDRLPGQVETAPVSDLQPVRDGFEASQLHDLGALEGGESCCGRPGRGASAKTPS